VVAYDTKDCDAGVDQATDSGFQRPQGLESGIRTLDHVAREQHAVDLAGNGDINGRTEGDLWSQTGRIDAGLGESIGEARRARAEVHVADGEELEACLR